MLIRLALAALSVSAWSAAPPGDSARPKPALPYAHHALAQKKTGFYAVYLPKRFQADSAKGKRYPLCVILHGSGSNEIDHGTFALPFADEDIIFCAPRAPNADFESFLDGHEPGWTAWPHYPDEWGEFDSPGFPSRELDGVDEAGFYADWIADCIRDMRKRYPIADGKAIVVGHSEGAAFAHIAAARHPDLVKAYAAFAGYYPFVADTVAAHGLRSGSVFSEIIHCEGDSGVPVEESRKLIRYLEANRLPHAAHILKGCGHDLAGAPALALREFVFRQGLGKAAPPMRGLALIERVVDRSRADSLGLRAGDRIVAYDGRAIRSSGDFVAARAAAKSKPSVKIEVERAGKRLAFTAPPGRLGMVIGDR